MDRGVAQPGPPGRREQVKVEINAHLEEISSHFEPEHRMLHKDGNYRWMLTRGVAVRDQAGKAYRMAGSQTDISERKRAEEQLLHDAFYDALTGLPNRALFIDRLGHPLRRTRQAKDYSFAVLFLDLDRFKVINDSSAMRLGMLCCARRPGGWSSASVGGYGRPARGDEFVMLFEDIRDEVSARKVAERVQRALPMPFRSGWVRDLHHRQHRHRLRHARLPARRGPPPGCGYHDVPGEIARQGPV